MGSTKEVLSAKEGQPGEERDPPCPTMSCSGMGGTFQAGQKCEGCHSVAKKPSNPPCVSSQLLVDNSYKRVIPTHPRCIYRPMSAGDCPAVQTIHERCLPVRYSAGFYSNACRHVINKSSRLPELPIFTQVAVVPHVVYDEEIQAIVKEELPHKFRCQDGIMVGVLTAQISRLRELPTNECLRPSNPDLFPDAMYLLTLCTLNEYWRQGIGHELIRRSVAAASTNTSCGVVYLHVITHNDTAMKFYEKEGFERITEIQDYYVIEGISYNCFLYAKYINGAQRLSSKLMLMKQLFDGLGFRE